MEFSSPLWFSALLIMPLVWGLFLFYLRKEESHSQLEKFIDKHLIPYLLIRNDPKSTKQWSPLLFWSLVYTLFVIAMAGPRFEFREIPTFSREQNLAILLDLSESMNATDILPSRLMRSRQKIEDLLNMSKKVKIGLIAFAADPHMITPLTEDKETIRRLLPTLDTDLVFVQGSKLSGALDMAETMLANEQGASKSLLVISDGGFEDASAALQTAKKLSNDGIVIHTLGIGSVEGTPLKVKNKGAPVISKLEREKFAEISKIGNGRYFEAGHELTPILEDLKNRSEVKQETKLQRIWEESFYLFLLPVLPFFLIWYRRGAIFALFLILPAFSEAFFYNSEQLAEQAFNAGDYETACQQFQDPYRKGVAYYRKGDYQAAEEMFRQSGAKYNLGNALALQDKLQEAIQAYEEVLEKQPEHIQAKENLELLKKMQEEEEKEEKGKEEEEEQKEEEQKPQARSQEDQDADLWLDQIKNDPESFLKNKFYLESMKNGTKEDICPW